MLGPEGQAVLQKANYIPTNLRLDNPYTRAGLRFIDPALVLDEQDRWEKQFNEILKRQPR
jgi:iron(III) transport system substrate-binding protein